MGMTVQRKKETRTPKVFIHKIADYRGGVSVATSDLGGDYLQEGAVLSKPVDGICHVVKTANISAVASSTDKVISVSKGSQFKVGDFVMISLNGKATPITGIDKSGKTADKITLKAALGDVVVGDFLVEAKAEQTTSGAALKYEPFSINGTGKEVFQNDNINTDAWLMCVTSGNPLPSFFNLKSVINY